jgi:predicted RNA binding protein YcfA (HicA-like mRNA interferase family)
LLTGSPTVSFRRLRSAFPLPFRMSNWPASKARRVLAALERIGWRMKRQRGSHPLLTRPDWPDYEFTFHDQDEIGPRMLARVAKRTGLKPKTSDSLLYGVSQD